MKAMSLTLIVLAAVALGWTVFAAEPAGRPSIEGTYILDYRELPDGTQLRSPDVLGLLTFTRDHRNFNVFWTEKGQPASISIISKYTLSATQYSEENLYYFENGVAGKGPTYDTKPAKGQSPVKLNGNRMEFQMPLHGEPAIVIDKNTLTATRPGAFVDHWKRIDGPAMPN